MIFVSVLVLVEPITLKNDPRVHVMSGGLSPASLPCQNPCLEVTAMRPMEFVGRLLFDVPEDGEAHAKEMANASRLSYVAARPLQIMMKPRMITQ